MRRTTMLAVTTAMAGGLLFAAAPAQAAGTGTESAVSAVSARGVITCNPAELRQEAAKTEQAAERARAARKIEEYRRLHATANALRAKAQQCEDADNNA
ncbi:hypothetical protein ACFWDI_21845 [Streptomyces sp. NPDC060064]|uniref:hypothetical protein n=1 Tax=Streptomyces sp. NPDC060064 TaxID=3347049 RepID=UPI0036AFB8C7